MAFYLILVLVSSTGSTTTQSIEFANQEACTKAANLITSTLPKGTFSDFSYTKAFCTSKGK